MTEIHLSRLQRKINRRFPDYHEDLAPKIWCLRKLWGWPETNDVGVFNEWEEIRIDLKGQRQYHVEIELATAPNGWHTYGLGWWSPEAGGGYAPAVCRATAWTTREEAIDTALKEAAAKYHGLANNPHTPETIKARSLKMIEVLKSRLLLGEAAPERPQLKPEAKQIDFQF